MKSNREYRAMEFRALDSENAENGYKVEGYASTFDRYELFEIDGVKYFEQIDRNAFDDSVFSDVVFRVEHCGAVYARASAGTVALDVDDKGLHNVTDLSKTASARSLYEDIKAGNYPQMSFAFVVGEETFDYDTNTRIINRISKVFDISPVTFPANPETELHTRAALDGVIKKVEAERLRRAEAERRDSERRKELKQKIMEAIK